VVAIGNGKCSVFVHAGALRNQTDEKTGRKLNILARGANELGSLVAGELDN